MGELRIIMIVGMIAATSTLLGSCSEWFPKSYRFRMTVEIDTPQGLRTGSSVIQVSSALPTLKLPDSAAIITDVRGEAVAIDLPSGTLFALLGKTASGQTLEGDATTSFSPDGTKSPNAFVNTVGRLGSWKERGRSVELRPQNYPMFMKFVDPNDPSTAEPVKADNLEASFGSGVKLRRITLTLTRDPTSSGIGKRFPWWDAYRTGQLDGRPYQTFKTYPSIINRLNFKQGQ